MRNQVLQGDAFTVMAGLPDHIADLIFVDPPYWMRVDKPMLRSEGTPYQGVDDAWDNQFASLEEYERFSEAWLRECQRLLKPDGSLWVIGGMQCIHSIGAIMQRLGFWLINEVVWQKSNPTPNFHGTRLTNSHELLLWATKSSKARYTFNYKTAKELNRDSLDAAEFDSGRRRQLGSIWKIPICSGNERLKNDAGSKLHSTQKPEGLLYRVLAICSRPGDLVFDPFAGTLTTAAVAKRMGRDYLVIEREQSYIEEGKKRLQAVQCQVGAIERADFDRSPPRVTLPQLIEAGLLRPREIFYLRDSELKARLTGKGKLRFDGQEMDMHTAAARLSGSKAERRNGYDYWLVKRKGSLVSLADIREAARERLRQEDAPAKEAKNDGSG